MKREGPIEKKTEKKISEMWKGAFKTCLVPSRTSGMPKTPSAKFAKVDSLNGKATSGRVCRSLGNHTDLLVTVVLRQLG